MKAWKSTDPKVIATIEEAMTGGRDALNKAIDWARDNYPIPARPEGFPSYAYWPDAEGPDGPRGIRYWHWGGSVRIEGLIPVTPDERSDPPQGWRYDKSAKALVPAKRQAKGKELDQVLADMSFKPPTIPGAPNQFSMDDRDQHYFCTWGPRLMEGAAWFKITGEMDERDLKQIDPALWAEIKVSEYYRALEDHEEAEEAAEKTKG